MRIRFRATAVTMLAALALNGHAAPATTQAVEFYNTNLQHYFLTADATEAVAIEDGSAGAGWVRTGRSFAVWSDPASAGVTPVCRFYSSGANSHFFTASAEECASLKVLEATQRAAAAGAGLPFTGWSFEGIAFGAQTAVGGQCAAGSEAITRVYNNGAQSGEGSNHRYVSDASLASMMADSGWTLEGTAFCAPVDARSGTSAHALAVTTAFPELAATWTGTASWNALSRSGSGAPSHSQARADLSLTIATDGTVTGTGGGCTIAGAITEGDGFHSLFKGTLALSGCTDAAFEGTFDLQVERAGNAKIVVRFGTRSDSGFVNVVGVLAADTPPAPASPGATGEWTGTVAWIAVAKTSGSNAVVTNVNEPLTLTWDGTTLGGSGRGCTFTGDLHATQSGLAGTVTATGCDDENFNGDYSDAKLQFQSGHAMAVILTRDVTVEGTSLHVLIRGVLFDDSSDSGEPPVPPGTATFQLPGTWSGDVVWLSVVQTGLAAPTGGASPEKHTLELTFAEGGGITGSGFGCTFSGTWSGAADGGKFTVTLTASGCTNAAFDGTYTEVNVGGMSGGATLGFEMHRTSTADATTTRVLVAGALKKQ